MNTFWDHVARVYDDALRSVNWAEKQTTIAEGVSGRVLEACCGTGALALTLRQRGVDVYALDLAPRMLVRAAARFAQAGVAPAPLVQGDVTRLPFPDRAFDYVLVTGSLGLLPRPLVGMALDELMRVGRRELRLLEPLEEREGFYWRRVLTWCMDGMRPIPHALLTTRTYRVEWRTLWGVFSYVRVICAEEAK